MSTSCGAKKLPSTSSPSGLVADCALSIVNTDDDPRSPTGWFLKFRESGDASAFDEVFRSSRARLHRVAQRRLRDGAAADDAVQQTFVRAIDRSTTFRAEQRLSPWLLGILDKIVREMWRGIRRDVLRRAVELTPLPIEDSSAMTDDYRAVVTHAIHELSPPYREVLELHLLEELAPVQVAERLERHRVTVRNQIARGLVRLRLRLQQRSAGRIEDS